MAVEPEAEDPEDEEAQSAAPKRRSKLPMIALVLLVLGAGGAGAAWYLGLLGGESEAGEEHAEEMHGEPIYFTLDENLVVNFKSGSGARFLQVGIDLMTYEEDAIHALEAHSPVLRNSMILLLSDRNQEELSSREGKEAVREQALEEVRAVMTDLHGSPVVESLYFTTFVMQ